MSVRSTQRSYLPSHQRDVLTKELTDQELYEHVIQVLPNIRAVASAPAFRGPSWRLKRDEPGVQLHEYDSFVSHEPTGRPRAMSSAGALQRWPWTRWQSDNRLNGSAVSHIPAPLTPAPSLVRTSGWPSLASGVPYAVVVQCELHCDVTEALDALFSSETVRHDATMRALWGKKFKRGDQLRSEPFEPPRSARADTCADVRSRDRATTTTATDKSSGWLAVNATAIAPKHDLHVSTTRHSHAQHLCFTTYSQHTPALNEAFFVMKTLPKYVHEQVVETTERSALRGSTDHIAVGYHLVGHYNDMTGYQTRLVMCAYVSAFPGTEHPDVMQWRMGLRAAHDRVNTDAKHAVQLLARAACEFDNVVRRRRFGRHAFGHVSTVAAMLPTHAPTHCDVCEKAFGLLRRHERCELCGHAVCRRCSRKYDVEPLASGSVRKHRVCYTCVRRVELRAFAPRSGNASTASTWYETVEEPDRSSDDNGGRATNDTQDDSVDQYYQTTKHATFDRTLVLPADVLASPKPGHQLAEALFSPHPLDRARALEVLKVAVQQVTAQPATEWNKPLDPALVGKYLEARQRLSRISSKGSATYDDTATPPPPTTTAETDSGRGGFPVFYQPAMRKTSSSSARSAPFAMASPYCDFAPSPRVHEHRRATTVDAIVRGIAHDDDDKGLDVICEAAAQRMNCPMAFVSVLGRDEQHVVGTYQVPECVYSLPRNQSIRSFGLFADDEPLIVMHPMLDARLRQLPIVYDAGVRFFASFPIKDRHGAVVASICTIDTMAHDDVSRDELAAMAALATLAADVFDKDAAPFTPRARQY